MRHDQLSKSLIETFFPEFLLLAAPDSAPLLQAREVIFLDKEVFTDWPSGHRRELDLLARVPATQGEAQLLVHVEIESRSRAGMDLRLWQYYMQIRLRHRLTVLPILVNLRGGRPGIALEVREEGLGDPATAVFRYRALGISGCRAEDWLGRPEPLAWAFAALMRPGRRSRAQLKMDCLRRISRSEVSGLRKEMLVNWVESYVKLRPQEAAEFQRLLEQEDNQEVETMALTWLGKAEARGKAEGIEIATEQVRREALSHLERQFGTVPEEARRKLESMRSIKRLTRLIARTPHARSIDDLGLN
jgi:hypothetical protein